ncbi:hypothetical protein OJ633_000464 [Listeria monocytogenes]|nr:hypothetical protein [Listeria monocytogenes]EKA2553074.1 hypothetical protein [Listeria monocytogenes]EKA2556232.1 hypothetical protein [Listeria monocytogenes]EKA2559356.1 hypothetical protein [Listeria monocytogenes]EKA2562524.1 hypothetical protein [Listeria monocytogenes]
MNIYETFLNHPQFQTPKMKLSEKIIRIETEKGYTQEEAAKIANIKLELFVQLELGREDIHIKHYMNTLARLEGKSNLYIISSSPIVKQNTSRKKKIKVVAKNPFLNNKFNRTAGTFL